MKAVIQRVKNASVTVDGNIVASINQGLLILLGVSPDDHADDAFFLASKIAKLRIFKDENEKMNLSVLDIHGEALVVSNFTLLANYQHGNRPDFFCAAKPDLANQLFELFKEELNKYISSVSSGIFGADMQVSILNDGPVTICMDSKVLVKNDSSN